MSVKGNLQFESLHNHTMTSDGELSHMGLLCAAKIHGFRAIAFTDHDALMPEGVLKRLCEYQGPVKWVSGIELSSTLPVELSHQKGGLLHIVGLCTNPYDDALRQHCHLMQEARKERMARIVANLNRERFSITEQDCLEESGGEIVGRHHIAQAILRQSENVARLQVIAEDMRQKAQVDPLLRHAYTAMMHCVEDGMGEKGYVFPLLLGDNAFVPGIYVPYLYVSDMDTSVRLIRDAGGLAFLAHYPTIRAQMPPDALKTLLSEGRLDGVETVYGAIKGDTSDPIELEEIVEHTNCLRSVGADVHTMDDLEAFAKCPRAMRTPGTLSSIVLGAKKKGLPLSLKHSNLV